MDYENRSEADKADMRTGYGCMGIVALFVLLIVGFFCIDQWQSERRQREAAAKDQAFRNMLANLPDPFASNAVVYSYAPPKDITGTKHSMVICSTNLDEINELIRLERRINYDMAVNEGKQLLKQQPAYEANFQEEYAKFILDKHEQKKLLFLPPEVKLQIIQKHGERVYECKVLQPGSEGMIVFIQEGYLTTH